MRALLVLAFVLSLSAPAFAKDRCVRLLENFKPQSRDMGYELQKGISYRELVALRRSSIRSMGGQAGFAKLVEMYLSGHSISLETDILIDSVLREKSSLFKTASNLIEADFPRVPRHFRPFVSESTEGEPFNLDVEGLDQYVEDLKERTKARIAAASEFFGEDMRQWGQKLFEIRMAFLNHHGAAEKSAVAQELVALVNSGKGTKLPSDILKDLKKFLASHGSKDQESQSAEALIQIEEILAKRGQ